MGMEKQAGRQRPGGGGHQRGEEFIPERNIIIAAERLRKYQRGGNRRAEKRPDGACGGENGPVQRAYAGQNACTEEHRHPNIHRHDGMLRAQADAACQAHNQGNNKPWQR